MCQYSLRYIILKEITLRHVRLLIEFHKWYIKLLRHKLLQNYKPHNLKSLLNRNNSIKIQQTHIVRTGFQVFTLFVPQTVFFGVLSRKKKGLFRHFGQMLCLHLQAENLIQVDTYVIWRKERNA